MVSRKRGLEEIEVDVYSKETNLLYQVRNMWEFANLSQWIFLFGHAVKLGEYKDIELIESECLKSDSTVLSDIGLAILKFVSSHRGLTPEIFDEYTRRQYIARAPHRNPFGNNEEPSRFNDFDLFTKIRVIQQLTQWTMINPERIREKMPEQKDFEQTSWRTEKFGWDSEDRTYIVLADNRLYRHTDPQFNLTKPKKVSKKPKATRRTSKCVKTSGSSENSTCTTKIRDMEEKGLENDYDESGMTWECVAITLEDYNSFVSSIRKSRDPNEKNLRKRITDDLIPVLEKQLETRQRKQALKERELLNLEKLACAKRSSRIASKMEQQRKQEEALNMERQKAKALAMAKKEQEKWARLEKERDSRIMTREQRLREREARRILHEEELVHLSEDNRNLENGEVRLSERHLKAEIQRKKQELQNLVDEPDWVFDCICGTYGQVDDGTHSIACDRCNTWQHSKCAGVSKTEADRHDFSFICTTCERRENGKDKARTKSPITIKLSRSSTSSIPNSRESNTCAVTTSSSTDKTHTSNTSEKLCTRSQEDQSISGNRKTVEISYPSIDPSNSEIEIPLQANNNQNVPIRLEQRESSVAALDCSEFSTVSQNKILSTESQVKNPRAMINKTSPQKFRSKPNNSLETSQVHMSTDQTSHHEASQNSNQNIQKYDPSNVRISPQILNQDYSASSHDPSVISQPYSSMSRRKVSSNFHTLTHDAPTLTPIQNENASQIYIPTVSPLTISPVQQCITSPNDPASLNGSLTSETYASPLPHAETGVSPKKTSRPRSVASNGNFGAKTPMILPPVASLTPSPQVLNLSPPTKCSGPKSSGGRFRT